MCLGAEVDPGCVVGLRARQEIDDCAERTRSSCRGSNLGEIAPSTKGAIASGTVLGGDEAVAAELELVVDSAMGREEALRMAGRPEPLHLPLLSSRGRVRQLGPAVVIVFGVV